MLLAYAHRLSQRDYAWIVLVGQMDTASSVKLSLAGDAKLWGRNLLCLALLLGDGCVTGKARDSVAAQCQIRHLRSALSEGAAAGNTAGSASLAVPCVDCKNLVTARTAYLGTSGTMQHHCDFRDNLDFL